MASSATQPQPSCPISPGSLSGRRQIPRLQLPCGNNEQPKTDRAVTLALASPSTISTRSEEEEEALRLNFSLVTFRQAFDLGEFIGSGSMSIVRRCVRKSDGQSFAVKCVTAVDEEVRQFTRDEFELVKSLRHPAIITFRAWYEGPVSAYIVMDLCSTSVESFIKRKGPLPEAQVQDMGFQLIRGVDYLHHKRVVHRDIKPANLLLHRPTVSTAPSPVHGLPEGMAGEIPMQWQLKITDFNSAKRVGKGNGLLLTDRGTQLFNAPELRFGRLWNERVDIWACGLCLYFMLSKHVPFNIGDQKVANTLLAGKLPQVDWSIMSPPAGNLIRQCLLVDPCDRPTAMELRLHPFFGKSGQSHRLRPGCRTISLESNQSIEENLVAWNKRRESKESTSTNSSFTASRRIALENPTLDANVMLPSCGLVNVGDSRVGREAPQVQRGSAWLEVEEKIQRRERARKLSLKASPLFLGGRIFPTPATPPAERSPQPQPFFHPSSRLGNLTASASARLRSHSMYLSTPKACDASPNQQSAKADPLGSPLSRRGEARSYDVLLRMANDKFRHINSLIRQESEPASELTGHEFHRPAPFAHLLTEVVNLPDMDDLPDDEESPHADVSPGTDSLLDYLPPPLQEDDGSEGDGSQRRAQAEPEPTPPRDGPKEVGCLASLARRWCASLQ